MDRFPQELIREIVEYVDYESLEPLRLVNKAFAAAAAPFLFEVIPLWIGVRSLERLTAISEHPQLSQYPKQIIFSPMRFIEYEADAHYRDNVKDWLEYQLASLSMHTLTMAKHMSAYRSYIEAQRVLSLEDTDVKILARAFSQLPRLESLHVDYWDTSIGSGELTHAFGAFKAEDLLSNDCQYTLPALIKALAASIVKVKVFKLGRDEDFSYNSILGCLGDYSAAATLARPRLPKTREFDSKAIYSYPTKISPQALSMTFCGENLETCQDALKDVRKFQVGEMNVRGGDDNASVSKILAALQILMQSAQRLETVALDEFSLDFLSDLRPGLNSVLPLCGLSKIKKLSLGHYQTTVVYLSDFFRRHGCTIVKVHFDFVSITSGDWPTALVQLRNLPFPQLETFVLSYCDEEENDLQVQDYILRKTDENPIEALREQLEREREQEYNELQQQAVAEQQQQVAAVATT